MMYGQMDRNKVRSRDKEEGVARWLGERWCCAELGCGRRRGEMVGFRKNTGGQPRIPALPCVINFVSLYKLVHFLSLTFLIHRMGIRIFPATGCQGMKFCYQRINTLQLI